MRGRSGCNSTSRGDHLPVTYDGKTFAELIEAEPSSEALLKSGLYPSMADIHAISDGGAHVIYTRFVHRGGKKIANPVAGEGAERVAIHLAGAKVARYNPRTKEYFYQVSVELKDGAGNRLWSGEVYGQWWAQTMSGTISFLKPPKLARSLQDGWLEP